MRGLATLHILSRTPGLLLINQLLTGEIGPQEPLSLPLAPGAKLAMTLLPLTPGTLPATCLMTLEDGRPRLTPGGVPAETVLYPRGFIQLTLCPQQIQDPPILSPFPEIVRRAEFRRGRLSCAANLIRYGAAWLMVEENGLVAAEVLLPQVVSCESLETLLMPDGETAVLLIAGLEAGQCACLLRHTPEGWRQELLQEADSCRREGSRVVMETRLEDTAGHFLRQVWEPESGLRQEFSLRTFEVSPCQQPETLARAFLEAVRLSQWEEAVGYLAPALANALSAQEIAEFLGEFDEIRPAPACYGGPGEQVLSVSRMAEDGIRECFPVVFTMAQGEGERAWAIANIAWWEEE